jgi:hypothetical protein
MAVSVIGGREAPRDKLNGACLRASRVAVRPLSSVTTGVVRGDSAARQSFTSPIGVGRSSGRVRLD